MGCQPLGYLRRGSLAVDLPRNARGWAAPLHSREPLRALLGGGPAQGDPAYRGAARSVLVELGTWRDHHSRTRCGHPRGRTARAADVHRDGQAQAHRPAPYRRPRLHSGRDEADGGGYPSADRRTARFAAAGRGIRLGRYGVDRAHDRNARAAVWLPLGGPPAADAVVGLGG